MNLDDSNLTKEQIIEVFWNGPSSPNHYEAEHLMDKIVPDELYKTERESDSCIIDSYTLRVYLTDDRVWYGISKKGHEKLYDLNWQLFAGFTSIEEFKRIEIGDTLNESDIFQFINHNSHKEKNMVIVPDEDDERVSSYRILIQDVAIEYVHFKGNEDHLGRLEIEDEIYTRYFYINHDGKVDKKELFGKIYYVDSTDEKEKLQKYILKSVGAVICGSDSDISIALYFTEDSYFEAGVHIFGNNGDSTFENAYYWEKGETTPLYNKGWMIWGLVELEDEEICWYPNGLNIMIDDEVQTYHDHLGVNHSKREVFDLCKQFILKDEASIKSNLKKLKINYPDGILLSDDAYEEYVHDQC